MSQSSPSSLVPPGGSKTPFWRSGRTGGRDTFRIAVVGAFALALVVAAGAVIWKLAAPLSVFFVAIVIAQALAPLVDRLERYLPRTAAIIGIYVVLLLSLAILIFYVVPPLIAQSQEAITRLPQLVRNLGSLVNRFAPGEGNRLVTAIQPRIPDLVNTALTPPLTAATGLLDAVQIVFLSLYWLIAMPGLHRFVVSLFPPARQEQVVRTLHDIGIAIGAYVRGTVLDAIAVTIITYAGLLVLGISYPLVLAVIAFLGEFVPLVGPTVAEIPAVGIALLSSPGKAIVVFAFYATLQQVDGNVILPLVIRTQYNISPLLVTLAVFMGAWVAGIAGSIIAIPLAAALQVIVVDVVAPAIRLWTGAASAETEGVPAAD